MSGHAMFQTVSGIRFRSAKGVEGFGRGFRASCACTSCHVPISGLGV